MVARRSTTEKDRWGTEHLRMHFYVEGPLNSGVVNLHMTKKSSQDEYEYKFLALDVKGECSFRFTLYLNLIVIRE